MKQEWLVFIFAIVVALAFVIATGTDGITITNNITNNITSNTSVIGHRIQDSNNNTWVDVELTPDVDKVVTSFDGHQLVNISGNATHWWIEDAGGKAFESNGTDRWIHGSSGSYLHVR